MDVLQVVSELRDLTVDPKNRATIVRDQGCLPGLVVFLDNGNPQVVVTSLEALYNLAEVPGNRGLMKSEVGLIICLRNIMRRSSEHDPRIVQLAQSVHNLLIPPSGNIGRPLAHSRSRLQSAGNTFLGASNRKAKTILLQIQGLSNQEARSVIESHLLSIKGIVSFTTDLARQRCTVRLRSDIKAETVCESINSTGILTAQQVVKNEIGEEILLSFGCGPEKENILPIKLPDYLPEEDNVKELDDGRALEKSGAVDGNGGGWFSSVTGMIGKAFYW